MTDAWDAIVAAALQDEGSDGVESARERVRDAGPAATPALVRAAQLGLVGATDTWTSGFEFLLEQLADRGSDAAMPIVRDFLARTHRSRAACLLWYAAAVRYQLTFASEASDLNFVFGALVPGSGGREQAVSYAILQKPERYTRDVDACRLLFDACLRAYQFESTEHPGQLLRAMLALDAGRVDRECFPHGEFPSRADQREAIVSAFAYTPMRSLPDRALSGLADALRETIVLERAGIESLVEAWKLLLYGGSSQFSELVALGLAAEDPGIRCAAMEARLAELGLEDWEERLYAMARGIPWLAPGANPPECIDDVPFCREQALALSAHEIVASVYNGGLCNIYGNGAYWMRFDNRLDAFEAIGAFEVARLIRHLDRIVGVDETDGSYDAVEARADAVEEQLDAEALGEFFDLVPQASYLTSRYVFENRDKILLNLPSCEEARG